MEDREMEYVAVKKEGQIAVMSLNRPKALNALNRKVVDEIDETLDILAQDDNLRVLVIHSDKNFAAGADIKEMVDMDSKEAADFAFSETFSKIADFPLPVIALIEGNALGGGLELALACDMRIASANAKLGFPEINLGIMPGAGGTVRAPRLIGEALAKEMIFTGRTITAEEALKMGLVNSVTEEEVLYDTGMQLAGKIARKAPAAMKTVKKTINAGLAEADIVKAVSEEGRNWALLFNTEDQKLKMKKFISRK
jgi:enoyl-CoA hydratase/carnithine racemase